MSDLIVQDMSVDVSESQWKQFTDCCFWLAHLYHLSINERPHLKTQKGRNMIEAQCIISDDLNIWHCWLVTYILMFNAMGWKKIDLSTTPPPKLPDSTLLNLMKHSIFNGNDIATIIKESFKLTSKERKILKELALRMTP